ncbi:MAG: hypothetical protein AAB019_05550 [Planctomycetota bacterium]
MGDKKTEQFYLEKFLRCVNFSPNEIISRESPDFIIKSQSKNISVEETEYHSDAKGVSGYSRRLIEAEWNLLQGKLMIEVEKHPKLKKIYGVLKFKKLDLPTRSKQNKFIEEVIQVSLPNCLLRKNEEREISLFQNASLVNQYLEALVLKNAGCYITWDWNHTGSWIGLSEEELFNVIKPKLIKNYKGLNFLENWLLIVSGPSLSQSMPLREHTLRKLNKYSDCNNQISKSNFSKVFIYQYMFNTVFEYEPAKKIWKIVECIEK